MIKRAELFTDELLQNIYVHHPYLLLFQKEDWREYLCVIGHIYDLIEEENIKVPFEVVRTLVIKFYAPKQLANLEQKMHQFFTMAIAELQVLKDSHDQFGGRYIETTRSGKQLLQLVEALLAQRTKFSGTGAETLLGALNEIIASRKSHTTEEAIAHHTEKIRAYQKDIQRIRKSGVAHAELLPIPHSNEALFNQAEEAAIHILSAVEDVKTAIERQRQELAQSYFNGNRSAGQSLNAIAEFYERLFSSVEYSSYNQAKNLLSYLESLSARFAMKNVDHLLHQIRQRELLPTPAVQRSLLRGFMSQFENSDHSIQEKVKSQLKILQQQVHYAINTDVHGLRSLLHSTLSIMLSEKSKVSAYFAKNPMETLIPCEFEFGSVQIFDFEIPQEWQGIRIQDELLEEEEQRALFLALLQAEEATMQEILNRFRSALEKKGTIDLKNFSFSHGLAEYYVLSEIELFDKEIEKEILTEIDLTVPTRLGKIVLRGVADYRFKLKGSNGVH